MALDINKLRKRLDEQRGTVSLSTQATLSDEASSLNRFAEAIRQNDVELRSLKSRFDANDFQSEEDYINSILDYQDKAKKLKESASNFTKRQEAISSNYNVLLNNEKEKAKENRDLLGESLQIFKEGFTKGAAGFKDFSEGIVGSTYTIGRQALNIPGLIKGNESAIELQRRINNDMDEYSDKFYQGIGKVLADNPVGNTFGAILNPVISSGLSAVGQEENVSNIFDTAAKGTQGGFKKVGVDMDKGAAAGYNEGILSILTLGAGKVLFDKVKGKNNIDIMSKDAESALIKSREVIDELEKNGNLDGLSNNSKFTPEEVQEIKTYTDEVSNLASRDGSVGTKDIEAINNRKGYEPLDLTKNTEVKTENATRLQKADIWDNEGNIDSSKVNQEGLANLEKSLKDGNLEDISNNVTHLAEGKNYAFNKQDTLKQLDTAINDFIKGEGGSKLAIIRAYNENIIKNKLDARKLITNKDISLEDLLKMAAEAKKEIKTLNRIGKLDKLEGSSKLKSFNDMLTKQINKANKLFNKDILAGKKALETTYKALKKTVVAAGKAGGLTKTQINEVIGAAGLDKAFIAKDKGTNIMSIKNKAIKLVNDKELSNKIDQIRKELSTFKVITKQSKAPITAIVKRAAEIKRLDAEIKGLIDLKAPKEVILNKKIELNTLKQKQRQSSKQGNTYLGKEDLIELQTLSDKFNYLKRSGNGTITELNDLLSQIKDLKSGANKKNTQRLLERENKINNDANNVIFKDGVLTPEAQAMRGEAKVKEGFGGNLVNIYDKGKKLVRNYFSGWDNFFLGLTDKMMDSTLWRVMRDDINDASDAVTKDLRVALEPIESKWAKWNLGNIPKKRQAAKDLTVYAWIKQGLADDLEKAGISRAERKRIIKDIEGDKVLMSIYNDTISAFKDAGIKMNKTSKIEDGMEVNFIKNYFPIRRKGWQNDPSFLEVSKGGKVNLEPYFKQTMPEGFRQARTGSKLELDIDANFIDIAKKSLHDQYYYSYMKPKANHARRVYDKIKHLFGELDDKMIKHYLDVVETDGRVLAPKNELANTVYRVTNWFSNNFAGVALGNAGTALKGFLSETDAIGMLGAHYWGIGKKHGYQYLTDSKKRAELYEVSPQLRERAGGESSLRELRGSQDLFSRLNRLALTPIEWVDMVVATPMYIGAAIKRGIEKGYSFDINDIKTFHPDMLRAGDTAVRRIAGSGRIIDVPQVLQNPLTKVFFPFQTNVMSRLGLLFQEAPRKFKQGELAEASGIIAMYALGSAMDKIISAVRTEARTQDVDELDMLDYVVAPERFFSGPSAKNVKTINETLFGKDWEDMNITQKLAALAEQSFYSEIPIINNIHSTLEYGSPLVGVEGHVINLVKSFNESANTDGITNKGLILGQNIPGLGSFAKQEVRARKLEGELKSTLPYYIKMSPEKEDE